MTLKRVELAPGMEWPHPGNPREVVREDRTHVPGGPAAPLLEGATWIAYPEGEVAPKGERPAYDFVTTVVLAEVPGPVTLAVTAHGVYEAFVNGVRVGDRELEPGFSAYHSTLGVQTYDVTALLHPGENEVRLRVSDGWFRGQHGAHRAADHSGDRTAVIAAMAGPAGLELVTDASWRTAPSHVVAADLMEGEIHDLRRLGCEEWVGAVAADDLLCTDRSRLDVSPAEPIRRLREYPAVAVTRLPSGRQIVDFGANINGWPRLTNLGASGTTTTLLLGEHLRPDGDVDREAFCATTYPEKERRSAGQRYVVTSRGVDGDVFEPRHSTAGFRYAAVDGRDDDLDPADLVAVEVRSDLRRTGTFACSDAGLTRLHEIAYDTWRANSCGVPTDCPTRERHGFTGDYQIFIRAAAFLEDVRGFSGAWLRAVADEQFDSGVITNVAPYAGRAETPWMPVPLDGAAGWGDAITIVPWALYQAYGDAGVLARYAPTMRRWVDYAAAVAAEFRNVSKGDSPEQPHERYLWDSGFQWGEWLEPGAAWNPVGDFGIVATAYLAYSARLLSQTLALLNDADADRYAELADRVTAAWRTEYWRDGRLTVESQANYVRGLRLGLIPDADRATAAARLVDLVAEAGFHLGTGFLTTPWLLPVLADAGYPDVAYRVLLQRDYPGWLVMLDRGATTVWEDWEGVDAEGNAKDSLSHYSKGGVIDFLHEYVAGLRPVAPGWRQFRVAPVPGDGVTWAAASLESVSGRIAVSWRLEGDSLEAEVTVPDGATATVELPGAAAVEVGPGTHRLTTRG